MPRFAIFPFISRLSIYSIILFYFLQKPARGGAFKSILITETRIFILIIFYSLIIDFLIRPKIEESIPFLFRNIAFYIECIIGGYVIYRILQDVLSKYRIKVDIFLMYIALVASIITTILILSPEITMYVRHNILATGEKIISSEIRAFAISSDALYSYSIAQGIALSICLHYADKMKWLYLLIPFFLISIFFNARIGIIPVLLFIVYLLFFKRNIKHLIFAGIVISILVIQTLNFLASIHEDTIVWVMSAFNDTFALISGEDVSNIRNYRALGDTMIIIPKDVFSVILGTGRDLFFGGYSDHSDIGYIIQLNYGGLIYCFLLLTLVFHMFFRLKKHNISNPWFNYLFLGTILICNWKGYCISTNVVFRLFSILYFYYLFNSIKKENCNDENLNNYYLP
jgi:hypothetical protein